MSPIIDFSPWLPLALGELIIGLNDSLSENSLFGQDVWGGNCEYNP
jgi:hypothetical protein